MIDVHAAGDCLFLLVVKVVELSFQPRRAITVQLILKVQVRGVFQGACISVGLNLMMTILFEFTFVLTVHILRYHAFAHVKTHRDSCLILWSFPRKGLLRLRCCYGVKVGARLLTTTLSLVFHCSSTISCNSIHCVFLLYINLLV